MRRCVFLQYDLQRGFSVIEYPCLIIITRKILIDGRSAQCQDRRVIVLCRSELHFAVVVPISCQHIVPVRAVYLCAVDPERVLDSICIVDLYCFDIKGIIITPNSQAGIIDSCYSSCGQGRCDCT